jgi:hypothetical protein
MGKKARIKSQRLAEAKGAKDILKQINALDDVIAESTAELVTLEGQKAKMLANMCIESGGNAPGGGQTPQRSATLGDLLNDSQMQAVIDILNRPNLDDIEITKLLKQYLGQFSQQFAVVGVVPDYLAYVLLANKKQLRSMARQSNEPEDPFKPDRMSRN